MSVNINTTIIEAKKKMLKTVNEILQSGVPISIIDMILDSISIEVKTALQLQLKQEEKDLTELESETV